MHKEGTPIPTPEELKFDQLVDAGVCTPADARDAVGLHDDEWRSISTRLQHPSSGMDPKIFTARKRSRPINPGTDRDLDPIDPVEEVLARKPIELSQRVIEEKDFLSASLLWSKALRDARGNKERAWVSVQSSDYSSQGNKRDIL